MLNLHLVREWRTFFEEVPPGSQHSGDPGVRRITARERSTVTCASKTPSKIDKNMLNLHFVREWHTFFWAQSQLKMKIRCFFQCFCLKIAQNLNFTQVFPRFFPQALLCGFSKLQLQTQATAQVGKSHSGRSRAQILLGPVLDLVPDEFTVNNGQR